MTSGGLQGSTEFRKLECMCYHEESVIKKWSVAQCRE